MKSAPMLAALLPIVEDNSEQFRSDFIDWLKENSHVYEAFEDAAHRVWANGFKHYSARTIMEVIRHRSNIRELTGDYKINNNKIPDCARLYGLRFPARAGLFEFRSSNSRIAA
jgi:uncharacterized protein (DUF2461 family)